MDPCTFKWSRAVPWTPDPSPEGEAVHTCVLRKNHKGDHVSVDGDRAPNQDEVLITRLPMHVNLGDSDWRSVIGFARLTRDPETRRTTIEITLDKHASEQLGNMVEVFDIRAVGFAGIKRPVLDKETGELK